MRIEIVVSNRSLFAKKILHMIEVTIEVLQKIVYVVLATKGQIYEE